MDGKSIELPESMAGLETHDKVFDLVRRFLDRGARIIDLGAGQGAFSKRLAELGHEVVAVDSDPANWKVPGIDVLNIDLDTEFAAGIGRGGFDAVVAIEIVEHVENPFGFAREAAKLLKPGGLFFLTTPNVEAVSSRLIFLYTGRLKHFGAWETVRPAHITPIFRWKLGMLLAEAGFEIVEEGFNRYEHKTGTNIKGRIAGIAARALDPFLKGEKGGECRIVVARRTN
ncbi:MAG TPA: methyltransferase domain-containing protein [Pyrinomonadaceae bacterium]|nr:methyltransferase domain-containing protein [Pyrinomonadaceae bacterium]